ncbi:MAG: hypothetical protein ACC707_11580 [Thiohalomonadales bacterium]
MYKLLSFAFIVSISLMLTSCLHVPTDSSSINSRSQFLRIYQDDDKIVYNVQGEMSSILEDSAGKIVINVQETETIDTEINYLYTGTDGSTIWEVRTGTSPNRVSTFYDIDRNILTGDALTGMKPKLTCANEDVALNETCYEKTYLRGKLSVTWTKVDDLREPVSGIAIPVMEEAWQMNLQASDAIYSDIPGPDVVDISSKRYISQITAGVNKGQIYVHALRVNKPAALDFDWVSEVQSTAVGKILSDSSPVISSNETVDIAYEVKEGCDTAGCVAVATTTKIMTYPGTSERRNLGPAGIFSVQSISISGWVTRLQDDINPIDMGYEIFSNCDTETQGVTYPKQGVSYSVADYAVFPDIGPVRIQYTCTPRYRINADAEKPITLDTSMRITAVMDSTETTIPYKK